MKSKQQLRLLAEGSDDSVIVNNNRSISQCSCKSPILLTREDKKMIHDLPEEVLTLSDDSVIVNNNGNISQCSCKSPIQSKREDMKTIHDIPEEGKPNIYLWNPLIQKYKTLPDSPLDSLCFVEYIQKYICGILSEEGCFCFEEETGWTALAFGFVPQDNDYVVVHIVKPHLESGPDPHSVMIGVYSLNTNSWKVTSQNNVFVCGIRMFHHVLVDGVAYWLGIKPGGIRQIIMCFDTKTDILQEILLPDWVDCQDYLSSPFLHPFGQSIAYFVENIELSHFDMSKELMDESGEFKANLGKDMNDVLCLYEASYLSRNEEKIMDEAQDFTEKHVKDYIKNINGKDENLGKLVTRALELIELRKYQATSFVVGLSSPFKLRHFFTSAHAASSWLLNSSPLQAGVLSISGFLPVKSSARTTPQRFRILELQGYPWIRHSLEAPNPKSLWCSFRLTTYLITSVKKNRLFEILEPGVVREGSSELKAAAMLFWVKKIDSGSIVFWMYLILHIWRLERTADSVLPNTNCIISTSGVGEYACSRECFEGNPYLNLACQGAMGVDREGCIAEKSKFPVIRFSLALGGLKKVLQLTLNHVEESREQPEPTPIPNGYGTAVKFPHLLLHPGFVMTLALVMVLLMSDVVAGLDNITSSLARTQTQVSAIL
ncbi:hypothetical protein POM88_036455 [Heracleum sosnowskyi]|uniref:Uncharacterized protein n=1 Tax=Heracleum sosnowskyi TaxID=360622 RepID=A0AAD8HQ29_9APIA|nr:hypothetical protein POM88_036455 [Heracleum sosnowskyi]